MYWNKYEGQPKITDPNLNFIFTLKSSKMDMYLDDILLRL